LLKKVFGASRHGLWWFSRRQSYAYPPPLACIIVLEKRNFVHIGPKLPVLGTRLPLETYPHFRTMRPKRLGHGAALPKRTRDTANVKKIKKLINAPKSHIIYMYLCKNN